MFDIGIQRSLIMGLTQSYLKNLSMDFWFEYVQINPKND